MKKQGVPEDNIYISSLQSSPNVKRNQKEGRMYTDILEFIFLNKDYNKGSE